MFPALSKLSRFRGVGRCLRAAKAGALGGLLWFSLGLGAPRASAASAEAAEKPAAAGDAKSATLPDLQVQVNVLGNGLKVLVHEEHHTATVAVCSAYDAGSRHEDESNRGVARLVQELLEHGGRGKRGSDAAGLIAARGGRIRNETTSEWVRYCTLVPKTELGLALWLEAGRFAASFGKAELEAAQSQLERDYTRTLRGSVYARGFRRLRRLSYQGYLPYEFEPLATPSQLKKLSLADVRAFTARFYKPSQAILSIAGDVEAEQALLLVRKYLETGAPKSPPTPFSPPPLPRQTSERLTVLQTKQGEPPAVLYGWVTAPSASTEHRALELANVLLAQGESSLLGERLLHKRDLAFTIEGRMSELQTHDLFSVYVHAKAKTDLVQVERELDRALSQLRHSGPSKAELEAARNWLYARTLRALDSHEGRAWFFAELAMARSDLAHPEQVLSAYDSVTAKDVRAVVGKYLLPTRRTIVELYPKGWYDPHQAPMPRYHVVASGETLSRIAQRNGTNVEAIAKINNLNPKQPIHPGQKLRVPRGKKSRARSKSVTHIVKKGDTLSGIAARYGASVGSITRMNGISAKKPIQIGQKLVIPR